GVFGRALAWWRGRAERLNVGGGVRRDFGVSQNRARFSAGFHGVNEGDGSQKPAENRASAFVDIAGVASSILATPTIEKPRPLSETAEFFVF
ncbi:MAG: hypothetical protein ACK4P1_12065, partial [Aggregatilineales bacterium]